MKHTGRIQDVLRKIVYGIYGLWFLYLMVLLLFVDRRWDAHYYFRNLCPNIALVLPGVAVMVAARCVYRRRCARKAPDCRITADEDGERLLKYRLRICAFFLYLLQLSIAVHIFFYVDWDVKYMREAAEMFCRQEFLQGTLAYLQYNPNNYGMLFLTYIFTRLGDWMNFEGYRMLAAFGIFLTNLAVYLCGICAYRLTRKTWAAYLGYGFSALLFGLSPWIMVPYTDIFSIIIPIASLYIYLSLRNRDLPCFVRAFCICILPVMGYLLKPTNVLVLLAIAVVELLYMQGSGETPKQLMIICLALLLAVGVQRGAAAGIRNVFGVAPDASKEKTFTHYLMMGWNKRFCGEYNIWDDDYTNSFLTRQEKQRANLKKTEERIKSYGFSGTAELLAKKTLRNFNNPSFGWGKEWRFVTKIPEQKLPLTELLRNLYYISEDHLEGQGFGQGGAYYRYLLTVWQFLWIHILLLCTLLMFAKDKQPQETLFMVSVLGIMMFVSLFECNARYLISYLPVFTVTAAAGMARIYH